MTKSYDIQHDYLFSLDEMANGAPARFDIPRNKAEQRNAMPVKASILLGEDGEAMFTVFRNVGKPILLINDLPKTDNPIVIAYSSTLIKGIAAKFHSMGSKVFEG